MMVRRAQKKRRQTDGMKPKRPLICTPKDISVTVSLEAHRDQKRDSEGTADPEIVADEHKGEAGCKRSEDMQNPRPPNRNRFPHEHIEVAYPAPPLCLPHRTLSLPSV
jgi:hypothetical protein